MKALNKLKVIGLKAVPGGLGQANVMGSYNPAPPFTGIQHAAQKKPLVGLGDILEAFDSLSMEQQMQLKATLGLKSVQPPSASHGPMISSMRCPVQMKEKVCANKPLMGSPEVLQAAPIPEQSFQFGNSGINSIRVSTFSGGSKDCFLLNSFVMMCRAL